MWTKREILPEFPEFVEGRNIGGHNIRLKTIPARNNPRPSHSSINVNYEDLDDHSDSPSPKRPVKQKLNVKKDGPTADRIAACGYLLRNRKQSKPPPASPLTSQNQELLTDNDTGDTSPVPKPKGKLIVTTHGVLEKRPKQHNFKCPDCDTVEHTHKEINEHFRKTHDKLFCEECSQMFNTPSSLECHMYGHNKEKQFPCNHCDEVFPFSSDLQIHVVKYLISARHQCGHGGCKKWFKRKGERDKHARTHNTPDLKCDHCEYTSKDICNL